jgi:hypothetical protein
MRRDELERLLWEHVDGALDAAGERHLARALAEHPEAGELAADVDALDRLLGAPAEVEPPPELRARIDRALASARPPTRAPGAIPVAGRAGTAWRQRLVSAAAGLVLGVVGTLLLLPNGSPMVQDRSVSGTMVSPAPGRDLELVLEGGAGTLTVLREADRLTLVLELDTAHEVEMTLSSDGPQPRIRSMLHDSAPATVFVHDGGIELVTPGRGRHVLNLDLPDDSSIRIVVSAGCEVLLDRALSLADAEELP